MCAIAGLFHLTEPRPVNEQLLAQMTDSMAHRGPDGSGFHAAGGLGFGHRRLSIIDLGGGHQPMHAGDGRYSITFNGEIYNYAELKGQLEARGHSFNTQSDTEVLLHAYMEWRAECVEKLAGMFAFVIFDAREQQLFIARDRVGIKPLYWAILPDGWFIFASELKALLAHPALPRKISPQAVDAYLALGYVPDELCFIEGVQKMGAGTHMTITRGQPVPSPTRYWDVPFGQGQSDVSADEMAEELRANLDASVKRRMIADVPLGAFLSGGVDSSAVVASMSAQSSAPVTTCSIGFDNAAFDETSYARQVAEHLSTRHYEETVAQDNLTMLPEMAHVFDEPFADNSCLPTYEVCRLARQHVTVALSGDGGDEVFAGYRRHRFHMAEEGLRGRLPLGLRKPVFGALGQLYPKLDWAPQMLRAKSTFRALALSAAEAYFNSVSILDDAARANLRHASLSKQLDGYSPKTAFEDFAAQGPCDDPLSTIQYLDFKTWLVGDILTKVDRTSMANSLEVRVPLLDHDFLKWAGQVPPEMRLRGGEGKWLFKKAFEATLPDNILYRKKMGFASPLDAWFRGGLADDISAAMKNDVLFDSALLDRDQTHKLLDEHRSGLRNHGRPLFSVLMLHKSVSNLLGETTVQNAA